MKAAAIFALLLLAGCNERAVDGYAFDGKEYLLSGVTVEIVEHASLADLRQTMPGDDDADVQAWSKITPDFRRCEVHIVDPDTSYAPEYLGHEIAHCIYGRWHP